MPYPLIIVEKDDFDRTEGERVIIQPERMRTVPRIVDNPRYIALDMRATNSIEMFPLPIIPERPEDFMMSNSSKAVAVNMQIPRWIVAFAVLPHFFWRSEQAFPSLPLSDSYLLESRSIQPHKSLPRTRSPETSASALCSVWVL